LAKYEISVMCADDVEASMRFANVRGRACVAIGDRVADLNHLSGDLPADPMAYVNPEWQAKAEGLLARLREVDYREAQQREYGPPVPRPGATYRPNPQSSPN